MEYYKISCLFLCIFASFSLSASNTAQYDFGSYSWCPTDTTFPENSVYGTNLDSLLSYLSSVSLTDHSGFYNISYGQDPDRVNAIVLCRGDVGQDSCRNCIKDATETLELCPNLKQEIVWKNECMLRYSNESIFNKLDSDPVHSMTSTSAKNASDPIQFNQAVLNLLYGLNDRAASGSSLLKFATGNANVSDTEHVYASVQCTPDLSELECSNCLYAATHETFFQICEGKRDCRVLKASCIVFYNTLTSHMQDNTATRKGQTKSRLQILTALIALILIAELFK